MSWDKLKESKVGPSGGNFVKLGDGESVTGVFMGDPYVFYRIFGERDEHEEWAEGRSFRFKINFIVKENNEYSAKIFEGGSDLRDQILAMKEEYGLNAVYKIKRTGIGKDKTKYSVLWQSALNNKQMEQMRNVPLQRLGSAKKVQFVLPPDNNVPDHTDEDKPPYIDEDETLPF